MASPRSTEGSGPVSGCPSVLVESSRSAGYTCSLGCAGRFAVLTRHAVVKARTLKRQRVPGTGTRQASHGWSMTPPVPWLRKASRFPSAHAGRSDPFARRCGRGRDADEGPFLRGAAIGGNPDRAAVWLAVAEIQTAFSSTIGAVDGGVNSIVSSWGGGGRTPRFEFQRRGSPLSYGSRLRAGRRDVTGVWAHGQARFEVACAIAGRFGEPKLAVTVHWVPGVLLGSTDRVSGSRAKVEDRGWLFG
ncbi:hypothetical protein GLOTRDRAFT_123703 [Gloeophyllum trabeum ATCC 11539]|uniref:Uncharacterized protein n=1 Tax=Gloeophyllum trabeum (strain ATCC 11539 / FP-39264 / Madison 617) TaxID=670483 RepID=S7QKN2_GLOTA|nr:uncharacterized protein GLOTRDRAFT_123703 [Gloeophyllum trabeum ATCC 11539]EPQ59947.1 hypothetical protein GLOTRDRAFT_123703 [Gloeophyllum trabeum ATCC 11539]